MSDQKPKKKRAARTRGAGAVFQRSRDGRWVARLNIRELDGSVTRKEFVSTSEADVRRALQTAKDAGLARSGEFDRRPIADFAAAWLRSLRESDYKASTLDGYVRDVERYIVPHLGTIPLRELDRRRVAAWMRDIQREQTRAAEDRARNGAWENLTAKEREERIKSAGSAAVNRARRTLSRMLSAAVAQDMLPTNPAQLLDRATIPTYRPRDARTLDREHVEKLFRELQHYRYGSMLIVALLTGARQSELVGLRWSDVDLRKGVFHVRRNLVLVGRTFHAGSPKTESSARILPLPKIASSALRGHRDAMRAVGQDVDKGLVWATERHKPIERGYLLKKMLYPTLGRLGLPRVTWHQLRHSCASILIEMGVPLEAVSRMLGHKDPGVTLRIYNKAFRGRERVAAEAVDAAFGSTLPVPSRVKGVKRGVKRRKPRPRSGPPAKKKPR